MVSPRSSSRHEGPLLVEVEGDLTVRPGAEAVTFRLKPAPDGREVVELADCYKSALVNFACDGLHAGAAGKVSFY